MQRMMSTCSNACLGLLTAILSLFSTLLIAQTPINPTTWGGTNTTAAAGPSNFSPLPATTTPGAAVVAVSQWNRGPGISFNAGAGRYNSTSWTVGASTVATVYANGDYLTFTVTNDAATELQITGVNIGLGQASGTGPNTFGLLYKIGTGSVLTFSASASGPSPSFTGTAITLCAGQTITFYMCGWGGSGAAGTWSINSNAAIIASYIGAVTASASSTSPVPSGSPLTFSSTVSGGVSPYSYSWSGPLSFTSSLSGPTISSPTISASGNYSLTVTDNWGCAAVATTSVTITAAVPCAGTPTAGTATPSTSSFCGSGSSTITLTGSTVASGITYQWLSSPSGSAGSYTAISGATATVYTTPVLTATTYYRCAVNCGASSLSDTSAAVVVTINPLPVITAPGGNACSGGSGLSITASGASTYTWVPATGLSATTGATVISNPTVNVVYTVTGTDGLGCAGTNTLTVNYSMTPASVTVVPTTLVACAGDVAQLLTATGGLIGPTTVNSGAVTIPGTVVSLGTIATGVTVAGVPAGATITGASVNIINFGSQFQDDYVINIKAPNGNVLNLINQRGTHTATVTTLYANTVLSSAGVTSLASGSGTYTGTWLADAVNAVGGAPYTSNITTWGGLFSVPNGNWVVSIYNNSGFTNTVLTSAQWSLTLNYSYQAPITWSPTTDLYTDAAGTIPYTGVASSSVYFKPVTAASATVTATATNTTCTSSANVTTTVNPLPTVITGSTNICTGSAYAFISTPTGGTWSASNGNISVGSSTGIVTAVTAGLSTVTYTLPTGCIRTIDVTINPLPPIITGVFQVCEGLTTTLSNAVAGGTWMSSNGNASIGSSSGIVLGVTAGTSGITYTAPTGCTANVNFTVNALPATISGIMEICAGNLTTLTNTTLGGTWSSSNTNATIGGTTGIVTANAAGTAIITYTLPTGCMTTTIFTVDPLPSTITGTTQVCETSSTTLSSSTSGGAWSINNANGFIGASTGVLLGLTAGTSVVSYTLPTGCYITKPVTVNAQPSVIAGNTQICSGSTGTLTNTLTGGTWVSGSASIATIGFTSGVLSGGSAGTSIITYTSTAGCTRNVTVTINPLPSAISGATNICIGFSTTLSAAPIGGTWTSSNGNALAASSTGVITGITPGTSVISYTLPTGCFTNITVTTNLLPGTILGSLVVCAGLNTSLSNSIPGGTWSSSNTTVASIATTSGVATGVSAGTTNITYSLGTGCRISSILTVNPIPPAITGVASSCAGFTSSLFNSLTGGTWTSAIPALASIDATTGIVSAHITGTSVMTYTIPTGCYNLRVYTVNASPTVVLGVPTVCQGRSTVFSCATPGGIWISSNTSVATITLTGIATGIAAGTSNITYTLPTGCYSTDSILVYQSPTPITGNANVCIGSTSALGNGVGGGTWSSTNTVTAPISASGIVSGSAIGTSVISYILPNGCNISKSVTVNTLPLTHTVVGGGNFCPGSTGSTVGLSTSDTGVFYTLIYGSSTITGTLPGTGSAIGFGAQTLVGTYTIRATNLATTCERIMTGTATVGLLPLLTPSVTISAPMSDTSCSGQPVTLVPTATNGGTTPIFQWKKNGSVVAAGPTYTYVPTSGDVIKVRLTSNATCLLIDSAVSTRTLSVLPSLLPTVAVAPIPNDTVCEFSSVTMTAVTTSGGTLPIYRWYKNSTYVTTASSYSYTPANYDNILCAMTSNYKCRTADTVYSPTLLMTVLPKLIPTLTINAFPALTIVTGQPLTLVANVTGGGISPIFQWLVNGAVIPGATSSSYSSSSFHNNDVVTCNVTSAGFCGGFVATKNANITVVPPTGVANQFSYSAVTVIPNPSKGRFTLSGTLSNGVDIDVDVTINNLLGQTIYSKVVKVKDGILNDEIELNSQLTNGMYILNLNSSAGTKAYQLIIEQ